MDESFLIFLLMSFILFSSLIISIFGTPSVGDVFGVFDRITGMIIIDGGGGTTTTTKPPTTTTTLKVTTTTTTTKPPTTTIPPTTTTAPTRCYCPTSLCSGGCWWGTGGPYLCSDSACSTTTTTTTTIPTSCKVRGCSSYYPSASCQCDVACLSTKASDCCSDACSACGFCPTTTTTTTTLPPTTTTTLRDMCSGSNQCCCQTTSGSCTGAKTVYGSSGYSCANICLNCGPGYGTCSSSSCLNQTQCTNNFCTQLPCCSGLECKEDYLPVSPAYKKKCCKPTECLLDSSCFADGYIYSPGNVTCQNGKWVTITPTTIQCDRETYQNHCEGSILVECNIYGEVKRTDCANLIGFTCVTGGGTAWCAKSTTATTPPKATKNKPPIAVANPNKLVSYESFVTLDGSASYDSDGFIVSYLWKEIDEDGGPSIILGKSRNIIVNFPIGSYVVELIVTDNNGEIDTAFADITIIPSPTCQNINTNCGTWPNCVNCNEKDRWYDTNLYEWSDYYFQEGVGVLRYDCFEYEERYQEYRDYGCHVAKMCSYIVQQTRTYETGNTRNKPDGTLCRDDGNPETLDYCSAGTCIHPKTTTTTLPPKGEKLTTTTTTTTLKPTTTTTVKAKPTTTVTTTTTTTPSGGGKGLPAPVPEPTTTTTLKPTTTTTVKAKPTTTTSTTTTTLPSCYDPDGGINTEVYGCIKLPDVILCDYCRGRTLIEFYCDRVPGGGWAVFEQAKSCYDCLNGVCIPPPVNKDLSGDGNVDFIDLSLLIHDWGVGSRRSDFNQDGIVDVRDFGIFLFNFG